MAEQTMTAEGGKTVTGIFRDSRGVEAAYDAAVALGYDKSDLNVVMSDETRKNFFSEARPVDIDLGSKIAEGGELGGPRGGHLSILIPILAAVGTTIALSGIGLVVAGPIAAAIAGAGATGLAAGLIGAFADWGLPEERLKQYEAEIHDGGILVGVKCGSAADAQRIAERWVALGAQHVYV